MSQSLLSYEFWLKHAANNETYLELLTNAKQSFEENRVQCYLRGFKKLEQGKDDKEDEDEVQGADGEEEEKEKAVDVEEGEIKEKGDDEKEAAASKDKIVPASSISFEEREVQPENTLREILEGMLIFEMPTFYVCLP